MTSSFIKPTIKKISKVTRDKFLGNKSSKLIDNKGRYVNVISLQNLLNAKLHDQMQKNMGKGRAKKMLNYRSGRFAKSAKITSLQQKQDKIIAFYNYMKFPYETFAKGGRQYIPGRTPQLIIGRSIRQLAAQLLHSKFKVYPKLTGGST